MDLGQERREALCGVPILTILLPAGEKALNNGKSGPSRRKGTVRKTKSGRADFPYSFLEGIVLQ